MPCWSACPLVLPRQRNDNVLIQNTISAVAAGGILAAGAAIRRWIRRVDHRLGRIEKLLDINGRDYAD
jgi:hypothetical protein